jgi:phytoene synthase
MHHTISNLVGSSQYRAVADDSLKDEDNAAWVMQLEPAVRTEWIERVGWMRLVDRLAENELIEPEKERFQKFRLGWNSLLAGDNVKLGSTYAETLLKIKDRWFGPCSQKVDQLSILAWDRFVEAIATYHRANLTIDSLAQYEAMLESVAGSFFQAFPFLAEEHWQSARCFGIVDQFYNNLRDLREDAEQGICYFPTELLNRFGVSREEILQMQCFANPGYRQMMEFWLDDYLPKLRRKTYGLVLAQDLHPSWQILRDWSLRRYSRIERVFRRCDFNYALFPQHYWAEVRQELHRSQVEHLSYKVDSLGQIHEIVKASTFLTLSPATVRAVKNLIDRLRSAQQNHADVPYALPIG